MNSTLRVILWATVLALFFITLMLCPCGCQTKAAVDVDPDVTTAIGMAVDQSREATVKETIKTTQNELWPMVAALVASDALKLAAIVVIVGLWFRRQVRRLNGVK